MGWIICKNWRLECTHLACGRSLSGCFDPKTFENKEEAIEYNKQLKIKSEKEGTI